MIWFTIQVNVTVTESAAGVLIINLLWFVNYVHMQHIHPDAFRTSQ